MTRAHTPRFGLAWLALSLTLAVHVYDEAMHDFLSVYNPNARAIRARFPFLPLPVFSFGEWLAMLAVGIVLLMALTPLAFRGARALRVVAVPIALLAGMANGALHLLASVYYGRWMPGVYTAPLLLAAGGWLLREARAGEPSRSRAEAAS